MHRLVFIAGLGQLALALGSLAIPRVLGWREEAAKLRPLTRQVFWTYAAYIWCAHVAFGLASVLGPDMLLDHSTLSVLVCAFIAAWWGARLALQIFAFDRSERPPGVIFMFAEIVLVGSFVFFAGAYAFAAWLNVSG